MPIREAASVVRATTAVRTKAGRMGVSRRGAGGRSRGRPRGRGQVSIRVMSASSGRLFSRMQSKVKTQRAYDPAEAHASLDLDAQYLALTLVWMCHFEDLALCQVHDLNGR